MWGGEGQPLPGSGQAPTLPGSAESGGTWEWRTLGVDDPGIGGPWDLWTLEGGPWDWWILGVADPGSGGPKPVG